jgi:hypothetical protein
VSTSPIRFDRVQAGLVASVAAALPTAVRVWAGQEIEDGTAGDGPLAVLSIVTGFDPPSGGASRPTRELPTTATLTISAPCRVWIAGMWWEAADRDDLLEQLEAIDLISATYEASGADAIVFEAPSPGDLHDLRAAPAAAAEWEIDESAPAEVLVESVAGVCSIDLYSRARSIRSGAMGELQRWRSYVQTTPGRELLDRYGLALGGEPIRILPLDSIAGPRWDSRARASFTLTTLAVDASTSIPVIETASVEVSAREPTTSRAFDIEIP